MLEIASDTLFPQPHPPALTTLRSPYTLVCTPFHKKQEVLHMKSQPKAEENKDPAAPKVPPPSEKK